MGAREVKRLASTPMLARFERRPSIPLLCIAQPLHSLRMLAAASALASFLVLSRVSMLEAPCLDSTSMRDKAPPSALSVVGPENGGGGVGVIGSFAHEAPTL